MEANRKAAKKWNSRHISTCTTEFRESNSSDDGRDHGQQLHQSQETCGLIKGVYYMPLYRCDSENPNTSNDGNRTQNNSFLQKHCSASYHGHNIKTPDNVTNVKVSVCDRRPHPHSFFQGKSVLPQPRSAQLGTASLRGDKVRCCIPSSRHPSLKAESNSVLGCSMHDRPVQWLSQILNDNTNTSNIRFRYTCLVESDKLDRTPLEGFSSLKSDSNVAFFPQHLGNSSVGADNNETNLRNTVSSPFITSAHTLVSEVSRDSASFDKISSPAPTSKGIQLLPPPPEYSLHLESQPSLSSANILANSGIPLGINLARSDLHPACKQNSLPLQLEGMAVLKDIKSRQSNDISIFKRSDKPDEVLHTSPASNTTVDDYTKLQAKLILADLDDTDSDYSSDDEPNRGAELINVLPESLKTSLICTNDSLGGGDDELAKVYSNTPSTLKRPNTPFNSRSTCQSTTPDAIKSAITPPIGVLPLDKSTTALFLQLTGEGEEHEREMRSSLYTSSSSAMPQVSRNIYSGDHRSGHVKDSKILFSDLFSELTESSVGIVPTDIKYNQVTETRCTLSADDVHIENSSRPALQQPESQMEAFCFGDDINPIVTDMVMSRKAIGPEDCIDPSKQVRPQAIKGDPMPSLSVRSSANFGHSTHINVGASLSVWKTTAFMSAPGRSPLYKTTVVKVQRPPLEAPLVTHQALVCLFRETPQSIILRGKILEKRLKVRPLIRNENWPPKTGADVEKLLKHHKANKLLRHLAIICFSRQHIKGVQELFNMWAQHGIPAPDMAFGAYYYYVKEKSEKLLCMKHNGRGATPGHGYGKCDFESRRPNTTCRYEHVCLFCRSRDHGWFEGDQCEGYQALLLEIEALDVLEEDAKIMLEAMERTSTLT